MKQCTNCKKIKKLSEFSNNKNYLDVDGKSKICKDCAREYYLNYKQKQIEKYGEEGYKERVWIKRLKKKARKAGISVNGLDKVKVKTLKFKMIDYPDRLLPYSLDDISFMKKYGLTFQEYLALRRKVKKGYYRVT